MPIPPTAQGDLQPQGQSVTFRTQAVEPPSTLYVSLDDIIGVVVDAVVGTSFSVTVVARILLPDGTLKPIRQDASVDAASGTLILTLDQVEGFLLSMTVWAANGNPHQIYAAIYLSRGFPAFTVQGAHILAAGYIQSPRFIGWPTQVSDDRQNPYGTLAPQIIAAPPAGTDWSFTNATNSVLEILDLEGTITTSGVAGLRQLFLSLVDPVSGKIWNFVGPQVNPATVTVMHWASGNDRAIVGAHATAPLPTRIWLAPQWKVSALTTGLNAGDQWSNVVLLFSSFF